MFASRFAVLLLLGVSAQAASLNPLSALSVPGPGGISALLALPDGSSVVCLGARWLQLDAQGKVLQAAALPLADLCRDLTLSPDGKTLLVSGNTLMNAATLTNAATLWNLADARLLQTWPDAQAGFLSSQEVLLRTGTKVGRLNFVSGAREPLNAPSINSLFVAPDGRRAVISDGQRVQLVSLPDFTVLSASRCNGECAVQNAHFSADGRTATALAGRTLLGLREGLPATTVMRDTDAAAGLPQPDNTVLTFSVAGVERRDFQTGRPELTLLPGAQPGIAAQQGGRVLAVSDSGELLDTTPDFKNLRRTPLPAAVSSGGLDASGHIYALNKGTLTLGTKKLPGMYWAVQTMNKTTWALRADSDGGLQVGLLSAEKFIPIPGSPRTATHLSVNFWGNHAAAWDDETLWVISQAKNKVVNTIKLGGKVGWITLSPDATRAFVYPGTKLDPTLPDILTLATGKRTPLPEAFQPAGGWVNTIQISGNGMGLLIGSRENLVLIDPKKRAAFNGAREAVGTVAQFSPDSKWLAYVGRDQAGQNLVLKLVNLETGKEEATSPPLAALPTFLTWSADSKKLAVGASLLNELASVTVFEVK